MESCIKSCAIHSAIEVLEQEPSDDMVSRGVFEQVKWERDVAIEQLKELGYGLGEKPRIGHCKECKNFEYNSVAKIDEIPLIVAHEICKKWGDGCKTSENGYCFLFEPKMSEIPADLDKESDKE